MDVRHVSNLLHVLVGERPVPTFRNSHAKVDPDLESAASKARFRIEETSSREVKNSRKSVGDSYQTAKIDYRLKSGVKSIKGGLLYPARLKRYLGEELYLEFLELSDLLAASAGLTEFLTIQRRIEVLSQHGDKQSVRDFGAKCKASRKTDIYNLIVPEGNSDSICMHQFRKDCPANMLLVPGGPETVSRYNGTIFIPTENQALIERLGNGSGVATFLEGGFAYLQGIESWSEALVHGAESLTKYPRKSEHVSD
jgi:hypothetical protein